MLTVENLKAMKPDTIFATGTAFDRPYGLHMTGSGLELRWVAVRGGGYHDWTIYCHYADKSEEWIKRHGDKVYRDNHIRMLVECDDEAFKLYRF